MFGKATRSSFWGRDSEQHPNAQKVLFLLYSDGLNISQPSWTINKLITALKMLIALSLVILQRKREKESTVLPMNNLRGIA